jgi:hypothetical protein
MCDPIGAIGLAFSIGSKVSEMQAQEDLARKQRQSNEQWLAYQRMRAREESARQESMRVKAEEGRQESLTDLDPNTQKHAQYDEQKRLEDQYAQALNLDQYEAGAAGQSKGGVMELVSGNMQQDYANKLTMASREARDRIKNIAIVQSYGSGSEGGLVNRANSIFQKSGEEIGMQGNYRQGSLGAYNVEKSVEPVRYAIGAGAGMMGGISQGAASIAGKSLGNAFAPVSAGGGASS